MDKKPWYVRLVQYVIDVACLAGIVYTIWYWMKTIAEMLHFRKPAR